MGLDRETLPMDLVAIFDYRLCCSVSYLFSGYNNKIIQATEIKDLLTYKANMEIQKYNTLNSSIFKNTIPQYILQFVDGFPFDVIEPLISAGKGSYGMNDQGIEVIGNKAHLHHTRISHANIEIPVQDLITIYKNGQVSYNYEIAEYEFSEEILSLLRKYELVKNPIYHTVNKALESY